MRSFLVYGYPWLLWGLLAAFAASAAACARSIRVLLARKAGRRDAALAVALVAAAALLRLGQPAGHLVYFDEYEHVDIAATMSRSGAFAQHLAGGRADLDILAVPTWPGMHHATLALAMRVLGSTETAAFAFNAALGVLSVLIVFMLGTVLFEDKTAGLAGAAFLAALPLHVQFSRAADLSPSSLFWTAAALLALALEERARTPRLRLLLLATLACACHARFENVLLVPACALYLRLHRAPLLPRSPGMAAAHAVFALSLAPLFLLALNNRLSGLPGFTSSLEESLNFLRRHAAGNLFFFVRDAGDKLLLALALFGVWKLPRGYRPQAWTLGAWAAGCFFVYGSFFRGAFAGSESRYALSLHLPLALLAGFGAAELAKKLRAPAAAAAAAGAFLLLSWPHYSRRPFTHHDEQHRFMRDAAASLPDDALTLSYSVPALLAATRKPAVSPYLLDEPAVRRLLAKQLVVFKDYWWHRRLPESLSLEKRLSARYDSRPIIERRIDGKLYGFYRLTSRSR